MAIIIAIIAFILLLILVGVGLQKINRKATPIEVIFGTAYVFSLGLFTIGIMTHSNPYYVAIDPIDMGCYSPFSDRHSLTLIFYFLAFNLSIALIWIKKTTLPPLVLAFCLVFILIGVILSVVTLFQISTHNIKYMGYANNHLDEQIMFSCTPTLSIFIGIYLIVEVITQESDEITNRKYSNKFLNLISIFLVTRNRKSIWLIILLFPVFLISTLILILFGQEPDSIVKIFTDTATWKLSQQTHPPILDHKGHYLCTVAAIGDPKIVKPIRFGQRNGKQIIVNRQLLIANAFEEMVQDFSPKLHFIIRQFYDKYGYNLSKQINTTPLSNITYFLMKPLEWFFLVCLYLFCIKPEQKINRQYK
ncbi:MAG: hypothetical protein MUF45_19080 [Spirosomaceae bacterium]|jgi:hypothetical protein|nr:hypothetical protein [Spirosomataceae bacterium]